MSGTSSGHSQQNIPEENLSQCLVTTMNIMSARCKLENMPLEILGQVFHYLPLADRKNIRLTCSRFYEACNTLHFQNTEEIAFYSNINSKSAILSLRNSKRRFWNIRLNEVELNSSFLPFFAEHGTHIYSLILYNCYVADGTLRDIITYCSPNLSSCAFVYNMPKDDVTWKHRLLEYNVYNTFTDLAALRNSGTICTKVTDFTLMLYIPSTIQLSSILSNEDFIHIFDIFPNIKKLDLRVNIDSDFDRIMTNTCDINSDGVFDCTCIYNQIMKMRHQLEQLCLHFRYSDNNTRTRVSNCTWNKISNIDLRKLRQISLNLIFPEYRDLFVFITNPSSRLENLTSLDCDYHVDSYNDVFYYRDNCVKTTSDKILLILNLAPNLRYLTMRFHNLVYDIRLKVDMECFVALVRSKLIIFEINAPGSRSTKFYYPQLGCSNFDHSALSGLLTPNCTLKQIKVSFIGNSLSLFSTYFPNLENLQLEEVEENHLHLLGNLKQLKSLYLGKCRVLSSPSSSQHLDNLTHLRVILTSQLTILRFSKFQLPKLKSLTIEGSPSMYSPDQDEFDMFWQTIKTFTQLEYLFIAIDYRIRFHQWLTLFQALPKLRHFHMWAARIYSSAPIEDIKCELSKSFDVEHSELLLAFDLYPSLRSVIIAFDISFYYGFRYYRDITKNEVICKRLSSSHSRFDLDGIPHYYFNFIPTYADEGWTRFFNVHH